jgi:hypothetical protein
VTSFPLDGLASVHLEATSLWLQIGGDHDSAARARRVAFVRATCGNASSISTRLGVSYDRARRLVHGCRPSEPEARALARMLYELRSLQESALAALSNASVQTKQHT